MINHLMKKARVRLGAICRLQHHLTSENLKTMYSTFVRSVLEYGNVDHMGARPTHLSKLDRVQATAAKMGGFRIESLGAS